MRKLILQSMVTLDGYFAGPHGELDWHVVDADLNDYACELLDAVDGLLFGGATYACLAAYWSTPAAAHDAPEVAERMNRLPKFVFSRTRQRVDWHGAQLCTGDAVAEVERLKREPGSALAMFGSSRLASSLIAAELIDEFRIIVNPVILGRGRPLFSDIRNRLSLRLCRIRPLRSGSVLLYYQPEH